MVSQDEAIEALARIGIVVDPPWARGMMILNEAHPELERMFSDSKWAEGNWRDTLLKLPGAVRLEKPRRIGGIEGPLIAIPLKEALRHIPLGTG